VRREWTQKARTSNRLYGGWPLLYLLAFSACSTLFQSGKPREFVNTTMPKVTYNTLAVIASDDATPSLQISATIRHLLNERGLKAVARAGRWETESDALLSICREAPGVEPVQGVIFVTYDTLILRECQTREVAYRISSGGGITMSEMADRIIQYVRTAGGAGSG
jgi:hypothetical protein